MKTRKIAWLVFAGVFATLSGAAVEVRNEGSAEGEWTQDVAAAQAAAKADGKYLFLNFTGSDWCGWCKLMDEHVFSQPGWVAFAKKHLSLAVIDTPKDVSRVPEAYRERNAKLKKQYGVRGFPTYVLLGADGHEAGRTGAINRGNEYTFITNVVAVFVEDQMAKLVSPEDLAIYRQAQDEKSAWEAENDRVRSEFFTTKAQPHQEKMDAFNREKMALIEKATPKWKASIQPNAAAKDVPLVFSDFGRGVVTNGAAFGCWTTDIDAAKALAKANGKDLLVAFVGTNWCNWGNAMESNVFNTVEWMNFAKENFVQVYVDCPDEKGEAALPEWLLDQNAALYKQYDMRGCPLYLLTDADGRRYAEFGATSGISVERQIQEVEVLLVRRRLKSLLSAEDFAAYEDLCTRETLERTTWRADYDAFIEQMDEQVKTFAPIAEKRDRIFTQALKKMSW